MVHLYHPWWAILHLGAGKVASKHVYTFCSSNLIQVTVLYFNIFHVVSHR
jgi:short subunit fatty acids transporter